MNLDVGLPDNNCVASAVIPYPGGFDAPLFCIPGLNFSGQVAQNGCGIGKVDTDGGSDFTVTQVGDTSSPTICGLPASNCNTPPGDSNGQIDITVGDGTPDICSSNGTGNAIVTVPVHTIVWSHAPLINCSLSGPDTTGPGGMGDTTVAEVDHTLDFTTGASSADFSDLDPDGCCLAGGGPSSWPQACAFGGGGGGPMVANGTCIDLYAQTVTVAASGPVFSNASPQYDLSFRTVQSCSYFWAGDSAGASCASPPAIDFNGTAQRCVGAP